ncbi:MAG: hypothetical protein JRD89_08145 [Deltaproteobacteria bacterium]|nr:hypothetical protein [Deltaproteobacteria bacterium]
MGSRRLKKKDDLRYRVGSTIETRNCKWCRHYVGCFAVRHIGDAGESVIEPRCRIMGLENSRRYRVRPDYTCDAQESIYIPQEL